MPDIESIIAQVSGNCTVSDARSAGLYSICGLALRLRDLFKWEKGLPPWEERSAAEVLQWIGEREELWDQISYMKKSGRFALACALRECGLPDPEPETVRRHLSEIFEAVSDVYLYHEIGEMKDESFDADLWREIVSSFPHTPVELLARTLKDLLADTNREGTLPRLIRQRKKAPIAFYVAFFDGLAKVAFPTLRAGFSRFIQDGNWEAFAEIVREGNRSVAGLARTLSSIVREGKTRQDPSWTEKEISRQILDPLQDKKKG